MKDKIILIINNSESLDNVNKIMDKIMESIYSSQDRYASKEENEMTEAAIEKFKKLYKEKFPEYAYSVLVPLYEENFTEEELDQILEIQESPIWLKMKKFSNKSAEKTEKEIAEFTSNIFKEAFADIFAKMELE
jgi:hypothetical protein